MALFLGTASANTGEKTDDRDALGRSSRPDQDGQHDDSTPKSLFASELAYVDAALEHLRDTHPVLDPRVDQESQTLTLDAPGRFASALPPGAA